MGETTRYGLPYPELTDTPDVPRDIAALANELDGVVLPSLAAPRAAALPGAPVDGQLAAWVIDDAAGVVWLMRWNAAAGVWEFVGGSDLVAQATNTVSAVTAAPTPVLASLDLPKAGSYAFTFRAALSYAGAVTASMNVAAYVGPMIAKAATLLPAPATHTWTGGASVASYVLDSPTVAGQCVASGLAAGVDVDLGVAVGVPGLNVGMRSLGYHPIRVSP